MVSIDHQSFPDIMDLIESSSYAMQLGLRSTNREWRDRIDAKLFEHVLVRPPDARTAEDIDISVELCLPIDPFHRLPFLPWELDDVDSAPSDEEWTVGDESRARQLGITKVVDYYGSAGKTYELGEEMTNLELIRRSKPLSTWLRAPTTVDYISPIEEGFMTGLSTLPDVPRCIIHINFATAHIDEHTFFHLNFSTAVRDVTIVFTPEDDSHPPPDPGRRNSIVLDVLSNLVSPLRRGARLAFVGVERVHPSLLDLPASCHGVAAVIKTRHAVIKWLHNHDDSSDMEIYSTDYLPSKSRGIERIRKRISYPSHTAWLKSLGEEYGHLETIETRSTYIRPQNDAADEDDDYGDDWEYEDMYNDDIEEFVDWDGEVYSTL